MSQEKLVKLKEKLLEIADLGNTKGLLSWDQATYMPPAGAEDRGRQMAMLTKFMHDKQTDPCLGELLKDLRPYEKSLSPDSDDASIIRVSREDFERESRVPTEFATKLDQHLSATYVAWTKARPANDFATMRPYLEKTLELSRELSSFYPGAEHIADPLINFADPGIKATSLRTLFADLRTELVPLVKRLTDQPLPDDSCVKQNFPEADQLAFGEMIIRKMGFSFERGRQDKTHHPFCTRFGLDDVRITTRVKANDFTEAFFSTVHEAGHALYELGVGRSLKNTFLDFGVSSGVHESQSRLWENIVGRSLPFWEQFYPELQKRFPAQLGSVPLKTFHRAINRVERSLVRTDADEVTYNLHVMIRFDLELALLEGKLAIKDLPEAWNERYRSDLGVTPPDNRDGVLQDVHWYAGIIGGAFQGYTMGNILSAQFYDAAVKAHPSIPNETAQGHFETLRNWLKDNVHAPGRKFLPEDLIRRATGQPMSTDSYLKYLKNKYGTLYSL